MLYRAKNIKDAEKDLTQINLNTKLIVGAGYHANHVVIITFDMDEITLDT